MMDHAGMSKENVKRAAVQSVDRAVEVLEILSREGWSGVTEVANGLGVHKSTAYRLLATLKDRGLVEQDAGTERYRLGLGLVALASSVAADFDIARSAWPICQRLSEQTQETVTITVLVGEEAVVIYQATSPSSVISVDWTGRHVPLHCTSDGKTLLAHRPENWQRRVLERPLQRFTENTIVDPARLEAQLRAIQDEGSAYTIEEFEVGLSAVAAPIRSVGGTVIAALSVSGPSFRLPPAAIPELRELTAAAAADISRRLGFHSKSVGTDWLRDPAPGAIES
jgi:DNA-binding IclR family transcriptional regulator